MIFSGKFIGNGFYIESKIDLISDSHKYTAVRATNGKLTIICILNNRESQIAKILDADDKPCNTNRYLIDEEDEFGKWLNDNLFDEVEDLYKYKSIRITKKYCYLPLCKKGHRLVLVDDGKRFIELPKSKVYKLLRKFKSQY